jgi:hypothetical protein
MSEGRRSKDCREGTVGEVTGLCTYEVSDPRLKFRLCCIRDHRTFWF